MNQPKPQLEHVIGPPGGADILPIWERVTYLLMCFRYMTRAQMQRFLFGNLTHAGQMALTRILLRLVKSRVVHRFRFDGKTYVYSLRMPSGTGKVSHDLAVVDVALAFLRWDSMRTDLELKGVFPDLAVRINGSEYLVEVDMGTEPLSRIEEKLYRYQRIVDNSHRKVLFVCATEHRCHAIVQLVEQEELELPIYSTAYSELKASGIFSTIWFQPHREGRMAL